MQVPQPFPQLLPKPAPRPWQSPGHAMPHAGLCSCWGGRLLPLLLVYVCYLLLGATIFQLLEKQAEAQSRDQFQFEKLRFLENYTCLDQRALEQFVQVKGRRCRGGGADGGSGGRSRATTWRPMPCLESEGVGTEPGES